MRTTVDIPDALHREIKTKAAQEGKSIRDVILSGIKRELQGSQPKPFRLTGPLIKGKRKGVLRITNEEIDDLVFGGQ